MISNIIGMEDVEKKKRHADSISGKLQWKRREKKYDKNLNLKSKAVCVCPELNTLGLVYFPSLVTEAIKSSHCSCK